MVRTKRGCAALEAVTDTDEEDSPAPKRKNNQNGNDSSVDVKYKIDYYFTSINVN